MMNPLLRLFRSYFRVFSGISLFIFLFILFFQPYNIDHFDFNNRLLFVAGFGLIVFLLMFTVRVVFMFIAGPGVPDGGESTFLSFMRSFTLLASCSVGFIFYLAYVGEVDITFYTAIKTVIICLSAPVILWLSGRMSRLSQANESLIAEKRTLNRQLERYEESNLTKTIEFISENTGESFSLTMSEIALIRSADNYVEIVYREGDTFRKKLIRNTLKNIENQIKPFPNFIRCHRICLINLYFVEKLDSALGSYWLIIKDLDEHIPVSRQYLNKLKEAL